MSAARKSYFLCTIALFATAIGLSACTQRSQSLVEDPLHPRAKDLPFVGTRFVNFEGKPDATKLVAIAIDGTSVIRSFGSESKTIDYRGQFSNPLRLSDGSSFQFKKIEDPKTKFPKDVITKLSKNGQIAKGCKTKDAICEAQLTSSLSSSAIKDGQYIQSENVHMIEVKDNQYRQFIESGALPWREIYELTPIQPGVLFDGKAVWCLPPNNQPGLCTEAGWKPISS
jgi:hypothetical protein